MQLALSTDSGPGREGKRHPHKRNQFFNAGKRGLQASVVRSYSCKVTYLSTSLGNQGRGGKTPMWHRENAGRIALYLLEASLWDHISFTPHCMILVHAL
jgi:hypothetical protein